jgi:hypothetical protein
VVEGTRRFGFMWLASAVRAAVGGVMASAGCAARDRAGVQTLTR